jgi:cobalamin biosynthetic protein CobC
MSIANPSRKRDHGGGIDAAVARFGGTRDGWLDLSTGINPVPYPVGTISADAWAALPDRDAQDGLEAAARTFWNIPDDVAVLAAPGASALIARIPALAPTGRAKIAGVTYNEHAAAFRAEGWDVAEDHAAPDAIVRVHPNNPDGSFADEADLNAPLTVIDESFCDVTPDHSLIHLAQRPNTLVLKSFGKFWGLAGLRIGFAVGDPALIARLSDMMGPWAVSGPALQVGTRALRDLEWAEQTRTRLTQDTARMDALMQAEGAELVGGTTLFRLYDVGDAKAWQDKMAKSHVWTRIFPYSDRWIRLGLPAPSRWDQFEASL